MFGDQELDQLYTQLNNLSNKAPKEKTSVFNFQEDDLNLLFENKKPARVVSSEGNKAVKKPAIEAKKVNQDFVLNLPKLKPSNSDKDLTLGEYLQKYNKIEKTIEKEQKSRVNYESTDIQKLINMIEENEKQPVNTPYNNSGTNNSKNMFISKRVVENIEEEQDRREKSASVHKALFLGDQINSKKVFTNKAKDDRKTVSQRIENFSNAKASLTNEKFMSPLSLQRYSS